MFIIIIQVELYPIIYLSNCPYSWWYALAHPTVKGDIDIWIIRSGGGFRWMCKSFDISIKAIRTRWHLRQVHHVHMFDIILVELK